MTALGDVADWITSLPPTYTAGIDPSVITTAHAAYASPGRFYHTWDHAVLCVDRLRTLPCTSPRPLFLALLFHDAIYVAGRADNEERSAALARRTLSGAHAIDGTELDAIERMILATHDHHARASGLSDDECMMLDIDLSILGASRDDYARYAENLRREYVPAVMTDARFRIGRHDFLRRALGRRSLFLTAEGRRRWEDGARANVRQELDALRTQQGVLERSLAAVRRLFPR